MGEGEQTQEPKLLYSVNDRAAVDVTVPRIAQICWRCYLCFLLSLYAFQSAVVYASGPKAHINASTPSL